MMNVAELNQINNQSYGQIAHTFDSTAERSSDVVNFLDLLTADLNKDDLVLDIGCGPGFATNHLSSRVKAVGIDLSPEFIEVAKQRYPDCQFEVGDMRKLNYRDRSVSGICALASLLHIPKDQAPQVLAEFNRILKPAGKAVFLMKLPDPKYSGDGFEVRPRAGIEVKRYFARYPQAEFNQLLTNNGFKILKEEQVKLSDKDDEIWLLYLTEVKNG